MFHTYLKLSEIFLNYQRVRKNLQETMAAIVVYQRFAWGWPANGSLGLSEKNRSTPPVAMDFHHYYYSLSTHIRSYKMAILGYCRYPISHTPNCYFMG